MTALNESTTITFKRLDLFPALGRHYVVKIFSLTSMKYCNIYFYTYCMWLYVSFLCVFAQTCISLVGPPGNFLVTFTS